MIAFLTLLVPVIRRPQPKREKIFIIIGQKNACHTVAAGIQLDKNYFAEDSSWTQKAINSAVPSIPRIELLIQKS